MRYKPGRLPCPVAASSSRSPPDVAAMLAKAPIFSALTERQLRSLAKTAKVVAYPAEARVVKQGEPGIGLYLLLSGEAEVRQGTRALARLGPGQFFGEMTLLDEQPRSADVVAVRPSECAVLSRWEFWGFAKSEPEVLQGVLKEMARRLRETNRALSE
jgi:CRP/FNR family transcriptional regulator, cyclic AMP receptor protein